SRPVISRSSQTSMGRPIVGCPPVPPVDLPIVRLDPELPIPTYARAGDAGADVYARHAATVAPAGGRAVVATRIPLAIPEGHTVLVLPRSGLAVRHGITLLNAPGLIDSGYRDELKVILLNTDPTQPYDVQRGDRIAQLVLVAFEEARFVVVDALSPS